MPHAASFTYLAHRADFFPFHGDSKDSAVINCGKRQPATDGGGSAFQFRVANATGFPLRQIETSLLEAHHQFERHAQRWAGLNVRVPAVEFVGRSVIPKQPYSWCHLIVVQMKNHSVEK